MLNRKVWNVYFFKLKKHTGTMKILLSPSVATSRAKVLMGS